MQSHAEFRGECNFQNVVGLNVQWSPTLGVQVQYARDMGERSVLQSSIAQGLSKHQEVGFTPCDESTNIYGVFFGTWLVQQKKILKEKYQTDHVKKFWAM